MPRTAARPILGMDGKRAMSDIDGHNYMELENLITERAGHVRQKKIPETLFHYTSSAAFLSIVQNDTLWFSDFRYMNDLSELEYGVNLVRAALHKRLDGATNPDVVRVMPFAFEQLARAMTYTDVFVFCMCEENNLLNQWRVYGRDTVPVSMELATNSFTDQIWEPYSFEIIPMVYDPEVQAKIIDACVDVGLEYAKKHRAAIFQRDDDIQSFVEIWVSICIDRCTTLKHPQFAVEKEWRLSTRWGLEHRVITGRKYRQSVAGIDPYLEMTPEGGELNLWSVTIGPCSYPEIQKRTMLEFLYQHHKANTEVHLSNLPIRV
jgi:hypothetical protein